MRSPLGGVFTGIIIILACAFLSPFLAFIPTPALSAVIIFAMFYTINYTIARELWKSKSKLLLKPLDICAEADLVPYLLTFLLGLFWSVEMGLIVGSVVHICLVLHLLARPAVLVEQLDSHVLVSPQADLTFPSVDHLRQELTLATNSTGSLPVILDMGLVSRMDYTAARGLSSLVKGLREKGATVEVCCVKEEVLATLLPVYGEGLLVRASIEEIINVTDV